MNKFRVCVILCISAFCALAPFKAFADSVTLTLEGSSGISVDGVAIYPYNFSIDGSKTTTQLMCISFAAQDYIGESWTATTATVAGNAKYEEAAYIFSLASAPGASLTTVLEAQYANWELFDPNDPNLLAPVSGGPQNAINSMLNQASAFVAANPKSSLYSDYVVYIPVNGSWPTQDGVPQQLIGRDPSVTPEPSSLVLFGSGLLGFALILQRRRRAVRATVLAA
jgi:hypothetical protein